MSTISGDANGYYDRKDGSIHVALDAGDARQGIVLYTAAHELTHFIRDWSPAKYRALSDLVLEWNGYNGTEADSLIDAQIAKARLNGMELSREAALEEAVADSMEAMLRDGSVIEWLAQVRQQDRTLWQKIVDWFRNLAQDLKALADAYADVHPETAEGRMAAQAREMMTVFQELYQEALLDASDNFQRNKKTTREGGKKFNLRSVNIDRVFIDYSDSGAELNAINATAESLMEREKAVTILLDNGKQFSEIKNEKSTKSGREVIKNVLKPLLGETVYFSHNGQVAEAYLTKNGLNHSGAGFNNQEKAASFAHIRKLIQNAEYSFSEKNDKHSNESKRIGGNIDWDVFVSVAMINGEPFPIIFKVRTVDRDVRSQIHKIATKEEVSYTHDHGLKTKFQGNLPDYSAPLTSGSILSQDQDAVKKFSTRNPQRAAVSEAVEQEQEALRADVKELRKLLELQRRSGKVQLNKSTVEAAANILIKQAGAKGSKAELAQILSRFFDTIDGDVSLDTIRENAMEAVRWLENHRQIIRDGYAQEILKQMRGTSVRLNDAQKSNAVIYLEGIQIQVDRA